MTVRFSGVTGWNSTKLEVNIAKLFFQDQFVLRFRKDALFLHKGRRQTGSSEIWGLKWVFFPKKLIGDTKLNKKLNCRNYRKQIAHQLRTQYVESSYSNSVTLKSRLQVIQGH